MSSQIIKGTGSMIFNIETSFNNKRKIVPNSEYNYLISEIQEIDF